MSVYQTNGRWRYRKLVTLPDGSKTRVSGSPSVNTRKACEWALTHAIARVIGEGPRVGRPPESDEAREERITVRASGAEAAVWRERASKLDITVSEWLRLRANGAR